MPRHRRRTGLTRVDVLVLVVMLLSLGAILLPALQVRREASRMLTCSDNLRQLGLAFWGYYEANRRLPPSSGVTYQDDGSIASVDGWSFHVLTLPYSDSPKAQSLYESLDIVHGRPLVEPAGQSGTPHADALRVLFPRLICPSAGPRADSLDAAIANYKGMGATHAESLSVASPNPRTPKYSVVRPGGEYGPTHPDGNCFPGAALTLKSFRRGTSYAFCVVESVEPRFARWTVGAEAAVVGLPPDIEFARFDTYWVPKGACRESPEGSSVDPAYWSYRTYLNWDYDEHPYDGADGTLGGRYGPGSHHRGVVNHLRVDGSCIHFQKNIDVTLYMDLIMRLNGYLK